MQMDIENILGVTRNNRTLGNTAQNTIQPASSGTTQEARNLVRKNRAFKHKAYHNNTNLENENRTNPIVSNNITEDAQVNRQHRHKHKNCHSDSNRRHGHSSRSHDHSSRNHGHTSRSHGNSSRSHGHSSRNRGHSNHSHSND
jgi:hypothetical protein